MLTLQSVSLMAGLKTLLDNASLTLHPGQRIGLIGQNGAGKSTLLKAILNEVSIESGNIALPDAWLVGYVKQEQDDLGLSAIAFVTSGDTLYANIQANISQAEQDNNHDNLVKFYDELDKIQGYDVPQKAQQLLYGLGFTEADFTKKIAEFSGGWRVRLKLAKALMQRADLLLLDEPTNHLDIEAVSWLVQWLKQFTGAVIVISHDRHFLDEVVQGIAHLDQQKIQYYSGNFASFERQRNEQLMQQQSLHDKQKQQMQHLKSFIERFKAKASKAKQAQSRVKALERMESVAAVQATNPFQFQFSEPDHLPDPMLSAEDLTFGYDGQAPILKQVSTGLRAGDRIGLVGINGSGKTTLLKLLVKDLQPQSGKVVHSKGIKVGYFAQHQLESLHLEQTPVQHLMKLTKDDMSRVTDQEARDFLGQFGFTHQKALDVVKHFSGGEKARLSLALMVYQKPNLIILDEPTNHLDMETRDALDMALQTYSGALILVTHDQHLLTSIVDQFWWVHEQGVEQYHGSLEVYLQQRLKHLKEKQQALKEAKNAEKTTRPGSFLAENNKKTQRQENAHFRKQLREATKVQTKQLAQTEKQLAKSQEELKLLHEKMEDSELYESSRAEELTQILKRESQLKTDIEDLEETWLLLETEIEEITETLQG